MNLKVSVIIPVYNVEKYLPACLDSVLGQTLREIEVICVNDGSTDKSPEILQEYGAVSPQTARAMVEGLLENTKADYAAATTGIAGPSGGSVEKPVGLVYIGVGNRKRITVRKFNVNPLTNRRFVKIFFAKEALKVLYDFLKENEKCTD